MNAVLRRYDKGDRRTKHVHTFPYPAIVQVSGNPNLVIGKCPSGMSVSLMTTLVNEAIPARNSQLDLKFHKRIYVVHEGAIYEAQTCDGTSYHGYPYSGKLPSTLIGNLRQMAITKGCLPDFDKWVDKYIERHGK